MDLSKFKCSICMGFFNNPQTVPCLGRHVFCLQCIQSCFQAAQSAGTTCPICRQNINPGQLQPDRRLQREMASTVAPCDNCGVTMSVSDINLHQQSCVSPGGAVGGVRPKTKSFKAPMKSMTNSANRHTVNTSSGRRQIMRNAGMPHMGMSNAGMSQMGMSNTGMPQMGMPNTGMSQMGMPNTGMTQMGMPHTGMTQMGMPHMGRVSRRSGLYGHALPRRVPRSTVSRTPVNRLTFTCPYCNEPNLPSEGLVSHCNQQHEWAGDHRLVCPICASMPWGDPYRASGNLLDHLNLRHPFDYDQFVDFNENEDDALQKVLQQSMTDH